MGLKTKNSTFAWLPHLQPSIKPINHPPTLPKKNRLKKIGLISLAVVNRAFVNDDNGD
jgi:hypothetical protein